MSRTVSPPSESEGICSSHPLAGPSGLSASARDSQCGNHASLSVVDGFAVLDPEQESSSVASSAYLNLFRLSKYYDGQPPPENDPDIAIRSIDLYDSTHHQDDEETDPLNGEGSDTDVGRLGTTNPDDADLMAPFPNVSSFELGEWFYGQGSQKSLKDFKSLIKILTSPAFSLDDIKKTKWTGVFQDLGKNKEDLDPKKSQWVDDSGWKTSEVRIDVPVHSRMPQGKGVETHTVGTLHHRSVVAIVEEKIRNADESLFFHLDGHELRWKPDEEDGSPEFRVLSELYNSEAFLEAQRLVRSSPPTEALKDCTLPRVVVGLSFWSDATHLSTFSSSKLWPLYMVFGNDSKYRRGKGAAEACYHVAYFDSVSATPVSVRSPQSHLLRRPDFRLFQGLSHWKDRRKDPS